MTGCTTCPFPEGHLPYSPSTPGNAFLLSAFAVLVPASLFLGYRFPALGFTLSLVTALCLEVLGFAGRLLLAEDGKSETFFALFLLGSALGETALAAGLLLALTHVLGVYGVGARRGARVALGFGGLVVVIAVLEVVGIAYAVFGIGGVLVGSLRLSVSPRELGSNLGRRTHACWWPDWRSKSLCSPSSSPSTPGALPASGQAPRPTRSMSPFTSPPSSSVS